MERRVVPLTDLDPQARVELNRRANWKAQRSPDGVVTGIRDSRYGEVQRIAILDADGNPAFDKINLKWSPAVFVVPIRINPEGKAEALLINERRPLLRDESGNQGDVFIDNIPQGLVKVWKGETSAQAALRETEEETGYKPTGLAQIGDIAFDAANSETKMPFYLAVVPYHAKPDEQTLDPTEEINLQEWAPLSELLDRDYIDGKTIIGLQRASRVIQRRYL